MVTGVRGLCNGLGPAVYGVIFYIFNVKVDEGVMDLTGATEAVEGEEPAPQLDPAPELDPPLVDSSILPGPPFLFGACSVVLGTCYTASIFYAYQPQIVPIQHSVFSVHTLNCNTSVQHS